VYVDDLIKFLRDSGHGCYANQTFIGCLMYADNLLLLSPTVDGTQTLLDIYDSYGCTIVILFLTPKQRVLLLAMKGIMMFHFL